MRRKLLAVMPEHTNYIPGYEVRIAHSFAQAKQMIQAAESDNTPFDDLDLPVHDEKSFWAFVGWMEATGRKYPFSIFGCKSTDQFIQICNLARRKGFHFNS